MIGVVSHFENQMERSLGNMRTLYMSDVEFFFLTFPGQKNPSREKNNC